MRRLDSSQTDMELLGAEPAGQSHGPGEQVPTPRIRTLNAENHPAPSRPQSLCLQRSFSNSWQLPQGVKAMVVSSGIRSCADGSDTRCERCSCSSVELGSPPLRVLYSLIAVRQLPIEQWASEDDLLPFETLGDVRTK